ncbi:MAG: hypothetical protein U9P07_09415 [Pseudomonadota bacterium]|nr:hypothetical protein [Pseudomonadota bacterium]
MAPAHSRRPSMAGFRGVRRESHRVIRSAANNRYEPSPNILLICPWQCKSES